MTTQRAANSFKRKSKQQEQPSSIEKSKMRSTSKVNKMASACILATVSILFMIESVSSSGVFEINFSSLLDAQTGRDLREDCCSWHQNYTAQQLHHLNIQQHSAANHHHHHQQQQQCDPNKCQLIIRICVKNYQTQIDPNQCTFGELSAQVIKPSEPQSLGYHPHYPHPRLLKSSSGSQPSQAPKLNIHTQRMLAQEQFKHHQIPYQHHPGFQQIRHPSSGQPRALRTLAFNQPISFPFNFTWPGSFSLIVDAWYESPTGLQQVALPAFARAPTADSQTTTYDLYRKQLIINHSMHGYLNVKNDWTNDVHKTDLASISYSYRVTCQPHYYGEQCNILCRPRNDVYGHYTCSKEGTIVCMDGWQGSYCLDPICSAGCDQGNCSEPYQCKCRFGWQGPKCDQCIRHPNCVHGSCNKPHECICHQGWGGLYCNEDLNYCTNNQPCKNGAICTNTFDEGGAGSYTCACTPGFSGKNCDEIQPESSPKRALNSTMRIPQHSISLQVQAPITHFQQPKQQVSIRQASQPSYIMQASMQPVQQQQQPTLDHTVIAAYVIIIVCMIIIFVLLLLRMYFERSSQRQWTQESSRGEDVATLQNHQNIYKSRSSLHQTNPATCDKMLPTYMHSDGLDSGCSSMESTPHNTTDRRAMHRTRSLGQHLNQFISHHLSQPNLAAQQANSGGPLPPPPPYTISQSHPNSSYYNNGSIYNSTHYGHLSHASLSTTANAIYNNSQAYGTTQALGSATTTTTTAASSSSSSTAANNSSQTQASNLYGSAAAAYQSPYYVIYYGHPYLAPPPPPPQPPQQDQQQQQSAPPKG